MRKSAALKLIRVVINFFAVHCEPRQSSVGSHHCSWDEEQAFVHRLTVFILLLTVSNSVCKLAIGCVR